MVWPKACVLVGGEKRKFLRELLCTVAAMATFNLIGWSLAGNPFYAVQDLSIYIMSFYIVHDFRECGIFPSLFVFNSLSNA